MAGPRVRVAELPGKPHAFAVSELAVSPDGRHVLAINASMTDAIVWRLQPQLQVVLRRPTPTLYLWEQRWMHFAFAPDRPRLALMTDLSVITVYQLEPRAAPLCCFEPPGLRDRQWLSCHGELVFTRNGSSLFFTVQHRVHHWALPAAPPAAQTLLPTTGVPSVPGARHCFPGPRNRIIFGADAGLLGVYRPDGLASSLFDLRLDPECLSPMPARVCVHDDLVVCIWQDRVCVFDCASAAPQQCLDPVKRIDGGNCSLSPDGRYLVMQDAGGFVQLWCTTTWECAASLAHDVGVRAHIVPSHSSERPSCLCFGDYTTRVLRLTEFNMPLSLYAPAPALQQAIPGFKAAATPGGTLAVISPNRTIELWACPQVSLLVAILATNRRSKTHRSPRIPHELWVKCVWDIMQAEDDDVQDDRRT